MLIRLINREKSWEESEETSSQEGENFKGICPNRIKIFNFIKKLDI